MEVLSQREIDKLLEALDSGDLDVSEAQKKGPKKIRKYDFSRPNKFGKEQMRTLHIVYEYYARLLSIYLSGILRTICHVELVSVEEQIFYEFNNSLSDPIILAVIDMPPLQGSVLMEVSTSVAYGIIDRILGGIGGSIKEASDYTEIEIVLLERIIFQIVGPLRESWSNVIQVDPSLNRIETNSRFIQVMSPNETIAIITLTVNIGDIEGFINVCIPNISIKPFEEKMSSRMWFSQSTSETGETLQNDDIMLRLRSSVIDIKAILGNTDITAQEILELQKGDVIQLNSKMNDSIKLCIGNIVKFCAVPGVRNNKIAVRIISQVDEEAEDE